MTSAETAWLRNHPVIRVGGPLAFPPFHYYDEQGRVKGISPDYIFHILRKLGVKVAYLPPTPWPRVLELIQQKKLDLIACSAKSPDRESYLDFSLPYLSFPLIIVTRNDASFVGGLPDLYGRKIALVKRVVTEQFLRDAGIPYNLLPVDTPRQALEAVSYGRADAGIENLAAAVYLIQQYGLANLKIAAPTPWGNYQLHFAVRQDWPQLVSIIDKAILAMDPQTQSAIRNKWISAPYAYGLGLGEFLKWLGVVVSPILLLALLFFLHNKRLKKEIREKEIAEAERQQVIEKLQAALDNLKQLTGLLPICASCKKIRDDQGYWQQVEEYIEEHSEAQFSHGICPDCLKKLYPDIAKKLRESPQGPSGLSR
ncbi:MAG: transporter substrate-binding domain-containing protein [Deltaproteobacteria bacterium]|nr:transporter substrate-binding domain-containing protein [Deltaproteobacteria bacterium]